VGYTFQQRQQLWVEAGGNPVFASIAAAISMAEDASGDPAARSDTNDIGLWQINLDAHPQYSASWLEDPLNNARAAIAISNNGEDWSPWVTYKSGAYQRYLTTSSDTVSALSSSSGSCSLSISLPGFGPIGQTNVCMDGPLSVGAIVLGVIVMVVGTILIVAFKTNAVRAIPVLRR